MPGLSGPLRRALHWLLVSLALAASALFTPIAQAQLAPISLNADVESEISSRGQLYLAQDQTPPASAKDLPAWLAKHKQIERVSLFGGSYWFFATVQNDTQQTRWVIDPTGTLMERVEVRVYTDGKPVQSFITGYNGSSDYMMHYGGNVELPPGAVAQVLLRIESRYFARYPSIYVSSEANYRKTVVAENVLTLSALGAMLVLALYNLFVYLGVRDKALLYYALYLLVATASWAMTLHVLSDWMGWRVLSWHYVMFFLSSVFNSLFFLEFLRLKEHAPRLATFARGTIMVALALTPVCFISVAYAHLLATAVISVSLTTALVAGMIRLGQGFLPARYFLAAFFALLLPAILILPANFGLVPSMMRNIELFTLLGATTDAVLLAFALADKIRLLGREKDAYMAQLNDALTQASTDSLTGIGNRHAFDRTLANMTHVPGDPTASQRVMLVMIDLDGLKRINDERGHAHGDSLLREFAQGLSVVKSDGMGVFRLGGDEFAVLGERHQEELVRNTLVVVERKLHEAGYPDAGISYGIAFGSEINSGSQLLMHADARMYLHKTAKRTQPA
ncbi:GGDEF domain-containing protein [Piscinibacter sp. HJYY11]|uniref:GGDEF domain-containing protein n=1 Tax=Piscinibacter sp. HJYY11 TaxID=2801333 RepID=UPI00191E2BAD|nr:GGDEF domain-containing protein [Piscinibacter sp. HJYY11]MBL0727431.1 diguanylate cyclase [Piscinibacter sp. HJYY11]